MITIKSSLRAALFAVLCFFYAMANAQAPADVPNPNLQNADNYVADPYHILPPATVTEINAKLAALRKNTTCEMAVAVVKNLNGLSVEDYSYQLFKDWGLGDSKAKNGVLLLLATDDRKAHIEVGSGAEGVLTDVACARILRRVTPAFKAKNYSQGLYSVVVAVDKALSDPKVAEELQGEGHHGKYWRLRILDSNMLMVFMMIVAGCVFLFTLALFISDFVNTRLRDNYRRAMTWRNHLNTYWWGAGLSFGAALPISLLAYALYRRARDVTEICDTCGAKMKKLSEDEDNEYLTPSQDFEEKIGTVDYDVWLCPKCGTIERFPYVERQLKYQKCHACDTIAMNLVMDKVVDPPTTKKEGHGIRLYQCQFCRHQRREDYVIPKKSDDSGALAAAVIGGAVGSSIGRGGSSGGFGGGFGGGTSSGGGASTSW